MARYAEFVRVVARRCGVRDAPGHLELWQELLLRVLQHLPGLHERVHGSFAGYLAWQVRDLAPSVRSRPGPLVFAAVEPQVVDADSAERAEFWRAVAACEEALPVGERAVFRLRFRDGLALAEIAAQQASNANAVAQSLFRLVRRMRGCLRLRGFGLGGEDEA
jgi:RNA polymerase sigma factor (sigma-70 family)